MQFARRYVFVEGGDKDGLERAHTAALDGYVLAVPLPDVFLDVFDSAEIAQAALPRFRALPGVEAVQGSPDNVEVTAQGVDKGTALLALADMLGIPREATAAIGDSENDRAMLARAGVAAVMANALPEIRALGDIVSTRDNDHDGVAELFERLGL